MALVEQICLGIDSDILQSDFVMQMRTSASSRVPHRADNGAALDPLSVFQVDLGHMPILGF